MRIIFHSFILSAFLILSCISLQARIPVKVACIGDSITFGSRIENPDTDSYPAQLQRLMGPFYEVRNYGFRARIMSQVGDHPYMKEKMYEDVKAFLPDVCVIMLGTNDTKPQNWDPDNFRSAYALMVQELRSLPSHPDIYLCYPPAVITERWGINERLVVEGCIPVIAQLAEKGKLDAIDIHAATAGMPQYYADDGVHPNADGASVIARTVYKTLRSNGYGPKPGLRILFAGDSITDGMWGTPAKGERNHYDFNHILGHGFAEMCAADCMAKYPERNIKFYNRGISGDTVIGLAKRWNRDVLAVHPDIVSILIGINDIKDASAADFDFGEWEATYRSIIDRTLEYDSSVRFVLCTPFSTARVLYGNDSIYERRHPVVARMAVIIKEIAEDYDAVVVDSFSMMDSLVSDPKVTDHLYWMWDGVHPTTAGHRKIADLWMKSTRKLLKN